MFPILHDTLSFSDIAEFWSREIEPSASIVELLGLLEGAWWRGEIVGEGALSRLKLIQYLFKSSNDFGIVFVVGDEPGPPETTVLPDGAVEIDLRPRINIPSSDTEAWNDTNCELAFQNLAVTSSLVRDPVTGPALSGIELSREGFTQWLARRGYPVPTFWGMIATPAEVPAPKAASPKGRPGRKPKFDWGKIEKFVFELLTKNGHWDDEPEDGWRSQRDLIAAVQQKCEPYYGEGKPDENTIKGRMPGMISRWREQSAGN
jgi:hypothetical protein